ncbi:hypothetical protein QTP88_001789 [Uroleucon formosanum]
MLVNLAGFCMETMAKDIVKEEEDLMWIIDILYPTTTNEYPLYILLIILYVICPWELVQILTHPKCWVNPRYTTTWEEMMMVSVDQMTSTLVVLMKSMKTSYVDLPVSCIVNLSLASTDISQSLLSRVELMEYRRVCLSWTASFNSTPPPPSSISWLPTTTTSTSATCAVMSPTPVDVHGSLDRHFGQKRNEPDFVEYLEESTCLQKIGETSVDIYLRAAQSSTELVASANMEDYVIDINIYQFVGLKMIKININVLDNYDDAIQIENLQNSIAVLKIMKLLHVNEQTAFHLFRTLCCTL